MKSIWFAHYERKPVAIYLMFPDINQILKHLNGKMDLISIIKFVWLKHQKTMTRAKGFLMGVIPRFHNHGIESAFILNVRKAVDNKPHYTEVEFSWVAGFNPKMRNIFISVGSVPVKNYITYSRYSVTVSHDPRKAIETLTGLFPDEKPGITSYFDHILNPK